MVVIQWKDSNMTIASGIENPGNHCFANASLQCLTHTPPLATYLLSGQHQNCPSKGSFCMMCELQYHIVDSFQNTGRVVSSHRILSQLKQICPSMTVGRQEDAHEFLVHVKSSLKQFSGESTLINQIFSGLLRSQVQCTRCFAKFDTYNEISDISLDISALPSVTCGLEMFVTPEFLDKDIYCCSICNENITARKCLTIEKAPIVLTLHLKLFSGCDGGKINKFIQYPLLLNLQPYMSFRKDPVLYSLYAVLVHEGFSCNSGHYNCYVKAPNGAWYLMNDSQVLASTEEHVLSQFAYMLFYLQQPSTSSKNSGGDATDGDTTATDGDATAQEGDANRDWAEQTENVFPLKEAEIQEKIRKEMEAKYLMLFQVKEAELRRELAGASRGIHAVSNSISTPQPQPPPQPQPSTNGKRQTSIEPSTLFAKNVPYVCTKSELEKFFQKFGEIEFLEMMKRPGNGEFLGKVHFRFKTMDAQKKALSEQHSIGEREIIIQIDQVHGNSAAAKRKVCPYFNRGKCSFAERCNNIHAAPSATSATSTTSTTSTTSVSSSPSNWPPIKRMQPEPPRAPAIPLTPTLNPPNFSPRFPGSNFPPRFPVGNMQPNLRPRSSAGNPMPHFRPRQTFFAHPEPITQSDFLNVAIGSVMSSILNHHV